MIERTRQKSDLRRQKDLSRARRERANAPANQAASTRLVVTTLRLRSIVKAPDMNTHPTADALLHQMLWLSGWASLKPRSSLTSRSAQRRSSTPSKVKAAAIAHPHDGPWVYLMGRNAESNGSETSQTEDLSFRTTIMPRKINALTPLPSPLPSPSLRGILAPHPQAGRGWPSRRQIPHSRTRSFSPP